MQVWFHGFKSFTGLGYYGPKGEFGGTFGLVSVLFGAR